METSLKIMLDVVVQLSTDEDRFFAALRVERLVRVRYAELLVYLYLTFVGRLRNTGVCERGELAESGGGGEQLLLSLVGLMRM